MWNIDSLYDLNFNSLIQWRNQGWARWATRPPLENSREKFWRRGRKKRGQGKGRKEKRKEKRKREKRKKERERKREGKEKGKEENEKRKERKEGRKREEKEKKEGIMCTTSQLLGVKIKLKPVSFRGLRPLDPRQGLCPMDPRPLDPRSLRSQAREKSSFPCPPLARGLVTPLVSSIWSHICCASTSTNHSVSCMQGCTRGGHGVIGTRFAKMTPNFGFLVAFGGHSWPPSLWTLGNSWAGNDPQSLHFETHFFYLWLL